MKILTIGDFHGKFPLKLQKLTREVDLAISIGDYPPYSLRKEFFKHCYKTGKNLWDVVGKKRFKKEFLKDWAIGEKILKKLDSLEIPVVTTVGNYDNHNVNDAYDNKESDEWAWAEQDFFSKTMKKYSHIKRVDYRAIKIDDIVLIGGYGQTFPGKPRSKNYKKHLRILKKLFREFRKENKLGKVIFVVHNMPYDCKLDKLNDKEVPKEVRGQHYGSKLTRKIIDKYQPVLCVGGHMHENQGKCKIGETLVVNTGASVDGKCAIIDFDESRGKVKSVKFVK